MVSIWLILGEYIISLISQLLSLFIFGNLFYKTFFKSFQAIVIPSPSINFYFFTQSLASFIASIYLTFLLVGWRPYLTEYHAYLMYFIGLFQSLFNTLAPVSVFALGLDRCLCVLFPLKYTKQQNSYPTYLAFFVMICLGAISLNFIIIPTFPKKLYTSCPSFACMAPMSSVEIFVFLRYFTSSLILATSVILLIIIRRKLQNAAAAHVPVYKTKKSNNLVLMTLIITLILDFLPHLGSIVFYSVFGINLAEHIGPYSTVTAAVESAFCAFLYQNVYKQHPIKKLPVSRLFSVVQQNS